MSPRTAPRKYVAAAKLGEAKRLAEHMAGLRSRREDLDDLLVELDDDMADAIDAGRELGLSMDTIAERLGTTRTTLYRCLHRRV